MTLNCHSPCPIVNAVFGQASGAGLGVEDPPVAGVDDSPAAGR